MGLFSGLTKGISGLFSGSLGSIIGNPGSKSGYGTNSLIGDIFNDITGVTGQMNQSYAQQLKAMGLQNNYNNRQWLAQINFEKEMLNKQNEYNSPTAQLARMREAGVDINPTSYALGTGNLSNTAALLGTNAPMSENGFSGSGSPAGNPISMLMGMASGIQNIRESKARTDNMQVQNQNLHEVTEATALENQIRRHNLEIGRDTNMPVGQTPSMFGMHANFKDIGKNMVDSIPGFGAVRQLYEFFRKK